MHRNLSGRRLSFDLKQYGRDFKIYSVIYLLNHFANMLASMFVNIYLFRTSGDFGIVFKYNAILVFFEMVGFILSGYFIGRIGIGVCISISLITYTLSYGSLLIMGDNASHYYYIVASVIGFSGGLYWMAYNAIVQVTTTAENRQGALSFLGMTANALAIIAPPLAGIFTGLMPGTRGYFAVFAIAAFLYLLAIIKSYSLSPMRTGEHLHLFKVARDSMSRPPWRLVMYAEFIRNIRDGPFLFYANVLLYYFVSGELIVGLIVAVKNILAVATFWFMQKRFFLTHRWPVYAAASVAQIAFMIIMRLFWLDSVSVILLVLLEIVVSSLTGAAGQYASCEFIARTMEEFNYSAYAPNVPRAIAFESSRIISILFLLSIPTDPKTSLVALSIVSGIGLIAWPMYSAAMRIIDKANHPAQSK